MQHAGRGRGAAHARPARGVAAQGRERGAGIVDIRGELIAHGNVAIALYEQQGRDMCRCDDHRQIVRFLAAGETGAAVAAMRRHLLQIGESLTVARPARGPVNLRAVLGRPQIQSMLREQRRS